MICTFQFNKYIETRISAGKNTFQLSKLFKYKYKDKRVSHSFNFNKSSKLPYLIFKYHNEDIRNKVKYVVKQIKRNDQT